MKKVVNTLIYSFPFQLILNHFKKNQLLLLCWVLLFSVINGGFAKGLGIPYLFLSPEYLNEVSFHSYFIVGLTLGGLIVAFNIASYILDGYRFHFIGVITKPFSKFSLNNVIIPLAFLINYIIQIINYQMVYEFMEFWKAFSLALSLPLGVFVSIFILQLYFWFTNKDFREVLAERVEKRIKKLKIGRIAAVKYHKDLKNKQAEVDGYFDLKLRWIKVSKKSNRKVFSVITGIFDQNHLNTVIAEIFIFVIILILGAFRDYPYFQIPAAASAILFLSIILMAIGAITFWFRSWAITGAIAIFFLINYLTTIDFLSKTHYAHGLNYETAPVSYNQKNIDKTTSPNALKQDKETTLEILNNWREQFTEKPKMVLLTASGGGQRAAYWTMNALQNADSITNGNLFKHTVSISGASGGLIGAAYFRELKYMQKKDQTLNIHNPKYLANIGKEALNPIIFSLLTNDIFIRYQSFDYGGYSYPKDRGYAFEQKLNKNLEEVLNKRLIDYKEAELKAEIPMLFLAPTSVNDGRKLYITPNSSSYMSSKNIKDDSLNTLMDNRSIDFLRMFKNQDAENLSFLTALRMSASFPYITPNVNLPSEPSLEIMDAGLADNFGVSDAVLFLYNFKDWIAENTSGVIILTIRDSKKAAIIEKKQNLSILEKLSTPISNIYNNWSNVQDTRNDLLIEYAHEWFQGDLSHAMLTYDAGIAFSDDSIDKMKHIEERASLNWRLTGREKYNIKKAINSSGNQKTLQWLNQSLNSKD
ncbi:patatin-like phospholipase family protein [Marivirga salinae]|uniref:Patatin-like phospholipase family protein n=1 Tax=Marivirga salinarum TaxID=3059078 RepID=A0AA49J8Z6_9BACT|nr:patatin-like phospholipase family protein [Marivirga sp. BDSF4-3]WKK78014.2 patatin-like phospholipase family protein [Marivirga sp. BDSF4-3]